MSTTGVPSKVAVVGAGIAGAALTQALLDQGATVHLFDKSCGPGGRLATRRCAWIDAAQQRRVTSFDHGAPRFSAKDASFRAAVAHAVHAGWMTTWHPRLHPQSMAWPEADEGSAHFVAAPDMPQWCRKLVEGAVPRWEQAVRRLQRTPLGWAIECSDLLWADDFDAVLLALPPAQAAPLLAPHRREWAQRASLAVMQPCWSVMGVTDARRDGRTWDVAQPEAGVLGWVMRNESRPGRESRADELHWVLHAKAGWSRAHIDQDSAWIVSALQQALSEWLGVPLTWRQGEAHRWRYATPQFVGRHAVTPSAWWDEDLRLGVCGDFLGSGGVEGAWLSAQALLRAMAGEEEEPAAAPACDEPAVAEPLTGA